MRPLILSLFILALASFGVPSVAFADTCPAGQTWTCGDVDCACVGNNVSTSPVNAGGVVSQSPTNSGTTLINPLSAGTNLEGFLRGILAFIIRIGTIVVILMLVVVGYKFVAARGAPGEIEAAKKALMWTLIGALVLLGAQAIATALQSTVGAITG